jgi:hypothetical protein
MFVYINRIHSPLCLNHPFNGYAGHLNFVSFFVLANDISLFDSP